MRFKRRKDGQDCTNFQLLVSTGWPAVSRFSRLSGSSLCCVLWAAQTDGVKKKATITQAVQFFFWDAIIFISSRQSKVLRRSSNTMLQHPLAAEGSGCIRFRTHAHWDWMKKSSTHSIKPFFWRSGINTNICWIYAKTKGCSLFPERSSMDQAV